MSPWFQLVRELRAMYPLPLFGIHGVVHWARVLQNGHRIADANGADRAVVTLFALFHDVLRRSDGVDEGHGGRAAELVRSVRGRLFTLDDARTELLCDACARHSEGERSDDPTVQACWDADRMDLGRERVTPDPALLGSAAARDLLHWADARARADVVPEEVLDAWGLGREPRHRGR